jgi:hypothetical protein
MPVHQHAVGEICQGIIVRQVSDMLFGSDALGNIIMYGEPTAGDSALISDFD